MARVWWNILFLSFALLASAQVPKKCSAPPKYPYTRTDKKFSSTQRFFSGAKVYYNCAEGFTPSRGLRVVQCINGQWTKMTLKCEKKSCGNAGDLPNGQFEYEGNAFLGEKVYAVCNKGYVLQGLDFMICSESGWTGEFPSCKAGRATCSTPAVANCESSSGDVSVHQVGDTVTFTCRQGFQLDGARQITCGPSGQWQPQPPRCLPTPAKPAKPAKPALLSEDTGRCGVPVTNRKSNANIADKYVKRTSFASGDKVHYVCDIGHIIAGGSRYRTCTKGKWTPLKLKCERKTCGSAGEIINGQFTYPTGVAFGDTATAVCDEGHILVGKATRHCLSMGWDGRIPDCEAVVCEAPPEETNAEVNGPLDSHYTFRSVIRYHCRVGTLVGEREIWCTKDETWSAPPPTCKEITCPSPNIPNALWTGALQVVYQYRHTISIQCNQGYAMTGPHTITCSIDGRWTPGLPKCSPMSRRFYWKSGYAR